MPQAKLWELVALSRSIDPSKVEQCWFPETNQRLFQEGQDFDDRIQVALANALVLARVSEDVCDPTESTYTLSSFVDFATSKAKWALPKEMIEAAELNRTSGPVDEQLAVRFDSINLHVQIPHESPQVVATELGPGRKATLYKQIAAVAILLAEKAPNLKSGDGPNVAAIARAIEKHFSAGGPNRPNLDGLGESNLRESIGQGIKLLRGNG